MGSPRDVHKPEAELERNEAVIQAVKLRRQGKSYADIAEELGVGMTTAFRYVQKHYKDLAKLATEELDHVRAQELARLDAWLEAIDRRMQRAEEFTVKGLGDDDGAPGVAYFEVDIAKLVLAGAKLQERRAKLLGLDAPTKVEVRKPSELNPEERLEALRQAQAALPEEIAELEAQVKERVHH